MLMKIPGKPSLLPPETIRITEQISGNRYVGTGIQITLNKDEQYAQILVPYRRGTARKAGARIPPAEPKHRPASGRNLQDMMQGKS